MFKKLKEDLDEVKKTVSGIHENINKETENLKNEIKILELRSTITMKTFAREIQRQI